MSPEAVLSVPAAGLPQLADAAPRNRGWFKPGHVAAVSHGLFSERDLANLNAEVAVFLERSVRDDGGPDAISSRRLAQHGYRARLHRRILQLDNALEVRGLIDRRGKLRVAWLQQLQSLISTARGIDSQLGLERRQKPAPSLHEKLDELKRATGKALKTEEETTHGE